MLRNEKKDIYTHKLLYNLIYFSNIIALLLIYKSSKLPFILSFMLDLSKEYFLRYRIMCFSITVILHNLLL